MKIKKLYNCNRFPTHLIVELLDGSLHLMRSVPYRIICPEEIYQGRLIIAREALYPTFEWTPALYGFELENNDKAEEIFK